MKQTEDKSIYSSPSLTPAVPPKNSAAETRVMMMPAAVIIALTPFQREGREAFVKHDKTGSAIIMNTDCARCRTEMVATLVSDA